MRPRFLNSIGFGSIALILVIGFTPARVSAQQAILDKTTFGQSQNDARDYMNSLVPGEKKYGKHEQKAEVNSADLKSKKEKDTTFGGSLLNMGIVGAEPKLEESKRQTVAETPKESTTVKQPEQPAAPAGREPLLQLSDPATLRQQADPSVIDGADLEPKSTGENTAGGTEAQKKTQTAPASESATDPKSPAASSEKPSKPDGDH